MPPDLVTVRLTLSQWRDDDIAPYFAMAYERDARAAAAPPKGCPTRDDLADEIPVRLRELDETGIALLAATQATGRTRLWASVRTWNEASFPCA